MYISNHLKVSFPNCAWIHGKFIWAWQKDSTKRVRHCKFFSI